MDELMKRKLLIAAVLMVIVAGAYTVWRKFYRDVPQPQWVGAD
jgi:hypothetical protein